MGRPSLHHGTGGGDQRGGDDAAGGKEVKRISDFGFRISGDLRTVASFGGGALLLLILSGCAMQPERSPDAALRRGCGYLWSQQAEDGGWHSRTYGLLKSGQSLSGFILDSLLQVPEQTCKPPAGGKDRAVAFLARNTDSEGAVGKMDPLLYDYPNYATALAVQALRRVGQSVDPMTRWSRLNTGPTPSARFWAYRNVMKASSTRKSR